MQETQLNSEKIEIVKKIIESSNREVLDAVKKILIQEEKRHSDEELNEYQLKEIEISKQQISNGDTVDWEDLKKRLL